MSDNPMSLSDISNAMNGSSPSEGTKEEVKVEETTEEVTDTETVEETTEAETTEEETTEVAEEEITEEVEETDKSKKTPPETVPVAAHIKQRKDLQKKIQAAEQNADSWRQQAQSGNNSQPVVEQPAKTEWADPLTDKDAFAQQLISTMTENAVNTKIEISVEQQRLDVGEEEYQDYEAKFLVLAQTSPDLLVKMRGSVNPAKYAYDFAKNSEKMSQDPEKYNKQVIKDYLEGLDNDKKGKLDKSKKLSDSLPQASLGDVRNTTVQEKNAEIPDAMSVDDIVEAMRKKR